MRRRGRPAAFDVSTRPGEAVEPFSRLVSPSPFNVAVKRESRELVIKTKRPTSGFGRGAFMGQTRLLVMMMEREGSGRQSRMAQCNERLRSFVRNHVGFQVDPISGVDRRHQLPSSALHASNFLGPFCGFSNAPSHGAWHDQIIRSIALWASSRLAWLAWLACSSPVSVLAHHGACGGRVDAALCNSLRA